MRNSIFLQSIIWLLVSVFVIQVYAAGPAEFTCPKVKGEPLPKLPSAYSTNIRINFFEKQYSIEVRAVVNLDEKKTAIEIWADKRHVKYIQNGNQQILIKYNKDSSPTCTVKTIPTVIELETEDAGPNQIVGKLFEIFYEENEDQSTFALADLVLDNSAFVKKWEGCFVYPKVNVSLFYTAKSWGQAHTSVLHKDFQYIVSLNAQAGKDYLTALFSNFNPVMPSDTEFQPPENVFCEGAKSIKTPPVMIDYFSYDSEIIIYESSMGIAPIASHRTVYYDYKAGISRTDFYDAKADDGDLFSRVSEHGISIIQDFKSGVQYSIDQLTGKCEATNITVEIEPVFVKLTNNDKMKNAKQFLSLNADKIVYNGQFPTRGYIADVFTASVSDGKDRYIYTWYFSSDKTQVVGKDNVEKDVLLRMVIQPEAADGKDGEVDVNFYNFERGEPSVFMYDITGCYSSAFIKTFVLTFPAKEELKYSEKLVKNHVHLAIKETTGVSIQRIFVSEVVIGADYIYAEFKLLAPPDAVATLKSPSKEITLEEAVKKLKEDITNKKFSVNVPIKKKVVVLKPEPNGLNEFSGDRKVKQAGVTYNEGGVIALTIGMLLLGFVLGGVTLNLIVSKKFGVSVFQNSNSRRDPFSDSHGDSSL